MADSFCLENGKLQCFMMMQNVFLKRIGRPPFWMVKIKFLTHNALERQVLHHRGKFCGYRSYTIAMTSQFFAFF